MNEDFTPSDFLTEFLLEQIADEPEQRRVLLYRALAADTADEALREDCRRRANRIEANIKDERQMLLDFQQRHRNRPKSGEENGAAQL